MNEKTPKELISEAHTIIANNFADPDSFEGRRAIQAINLLRQALCALADVEKEMADRYSKLEAWAAMRDAGHDDLRNRLNSSKSALSCLEEIRTERVASRGLLNEASCISKARVLLQ